MTLLELIIACSILLILAGMAVPLARVAVVRKKEQHLRSYLREMRDAIDQYKNDSTKGLIQSQNGTDGYPPDLDTLVAGVPLAGAPDKRVRYLQEVPEDPMTKSKNWGLRSAQDAPASATWGGQDVFDVYSESTATALDGTKYSDW